jgi:peptidoglycan/LPS O-acetylase OafA/YrhL
LFEYPKAISRNLGVDLARTFAIVGVLLIHTTGLWFGRFGVQLFFMISGYLLADFETISYISLKSFLHFETRNVE